MKKRKRMSEERKGKQLLGDNPNAKKVINIKTLQLFNTLKEAAFSINIDSRQLGGYLNNQCRNPTNLLWMYNFENYVLPLIENENNDLEIKVINTLNKVIYDNIANAAKSEKISAKGLKRILDGKIKNTTYFILLKDYKGKIKNL